MKTLKILISIFAFFILSSCKLEFPICTGLSDSFSINEKKIELKKSIGLGGDFETYFNPLFLPIKIVYNSEFGFSIINEGEIATLTPLGTVGIEYTFGSQEEKTINGHEVTGGDFVVGLTNKRKKETHLYKIEGYNRLKIITTGKTQIDAQSGYVEIDITDAKVQELTFIDNSKISIVNTTNEVQKFKVSIKDYTDSESTYLCEVEPHSYKYFPRFGIAKSFNGMFDSQYYVKVINNDERNSSSTEISKEIDFGDACHIIKKDNILSLKKMKSIH